MARKFGTIPLHRKPWGSKRLTQVRSVDIQEGRVAITIYLSMKDAINLAKQIQAEWPSKFKS
jgi:hypothetical protein